jgi:NAD(P)H dehydrogenase (quinone)
MSATLELLVLYYSANGSVARLAGEIAKGINAVEGCSARVRTVPRVNTVITQIEPAVPDDGPPYVEASDLAECAGIALGSPTRFGNMAAPMKFFIDTLASEWMQGTLVGKPACVFTSAGSMHGGQESTLLTMMLPLLHHGMFIMGLPFTERRLNTTTTGGSPYGVTHWAGALGKQAMSEDELALAFAQGQRLAQTAQQLLRGRNEL